MVSPSKQNVVGLKSHTQGIASVTLIGAKTE